MDILSWKASLQEYEQEKKWVPQLPKPELKTYSSLAKLEKTYNPILQTYTSKETEASRKHSESQKLIQTLAKNQDQALRYEQTFNIINLENKLKGLEKVPGYPIEKLPNYKNRKLANTTTADYNIISGFNFADHHFLPPDQRPPRPIEIPKTYQISAVENRDYNIITNRYLQNHEEKTKIDKESYKQESAVKY